LFLQALLPLILFLIVAIIWMIVYIIKKEYVKDLTRNFVISMISILLLLHPKLTQESLNAFRCIEVDNNMKVARFDTDLE